MPAKIGADYHLPKKPDVDIVPDIVLGDKKGYAAAEALPAHATYMTTMPFHGIPNGPHASEEWVKIPVEEQKLLARLWRFFGLRSREDVKNRTFQINKSTMDLP